MMNASESSAAKSSTPRIVEMCQFVLADGVMENIFRAISRNLIICVMIVCLHLRIVLADCVMQRNFPIIRIYNTIFWHFCSVHFRFVLADGVM